MAALAASAHAQAGPRQSGPRLIPAAANSIVVTLQLGPGQPLTQTLVRPPPVQLPYPGGLIPQPIPTTATFDNLPRRDLHRLRRCAPEPGRHRRGAGAGERAADGAAGQTATLSLTMGSTIVRVAVTPNPASVIVGQTVPLVATAYDATGSAVLTSAFAWTSGAAEASVDPTAGLVTGIAPTPVNPPAPVQITATEPESGVSGTGAVTVLPATARITGVVEDAVDKSTVSGATVVISAASVTVDTEIAGQDNREARFTSRLLPPGTYTLAVSAPNYQPNSVTVTLKPRPGPGCWHHPPQFPGRAHPGYGQGWDCHTARGPFRGDRHADAGGRWQCPFLDDGYERSFNDGLVPIGVYNLVASANGLTPQHLGR